MSILIKGMEMPKHGGINICIFSDGKIYKSFHGIGFDPVQGACAISVPEHGRLIDADKLERGLRQMAKYQTGERQQGILGCCETIRFAKTIIPASKESET